MTASICDVVMIGDSLLNDGDDVCTWAERVASGRNLKGHNLAAPGTKSANLISQLEVGRESLPGCCAALVGGGGNDLLEDLPRAMNETEAPALFTAICQNKRQALVFLYENGIRHFVVTGVPFSTCAPGIRRLVQQYARGKGLAFEEANASVVTLRHALNEQMSAMLQELHQTHPGMMITYFDEVEVFETWDVEANLFDPEGDGVHPTQDGHDGLARAVLGILPPSFPKKPAETGSVTQEDSAPFTPQVTPAPEDWAEAPPNPSQHDSLDDRFTAKTAAVAQLQKVSSQQKLIFYKFYKQATVGDNTRPKPSSFGFRASVDYQKWWAWSGCQGMSQDDAKQRYIDEYERFISIRRRTK